MITIFGQPDIIFYKFFHLNENKWNKNGNHTLQASRAFSWSGAMRKACVKNCIALSMQSS